ncbi:MAG: 2-amino-4-hydroxy-6-hydroxymethyldihydropteridine diphosphokinase [Hyphomicrobiales bacterium]|nr:2-amino-4-hydroxy-6-hydroxymethyldihydropteridine diphosphokinase [Hyphomicrobiales bacterium]
MTEEADRVHRAILSLGGNVGDVTAGFASAIAALAIHPAISVAKTSSVWRTKPWGLEDQPDFLNMAIEVSTGLNAGALLDVCLSIEKNHGRVRERRWGPRTLDIDIIIYDNLTCETERLTLPHPRAHERGFVLAPLCEMAPDAVLGARRAADWLRRLPDAAADWALDEIETERLRRAMAAERR